MELISYCLKTKTKEKMLNAIISLTSKGGFIAKGISKDGHKMSLIMSKANAEAAVTEGLATKEGW